MMMVKADTFKSEVLQRRYFNYIIRTLVHTIDSSAVFTRGHSEKVMKYCAKMAKAFQLSKKETTKIL